MTLLIRYSFFNLFSLFIEFSIILSSTDLRNWRNRANSSFLRIILTFDIFRIQHIILHLLYKGQRNLVKWRHLGEFLKNIVCFFKFFNIFELLLVAIPQGIFYINSFLKFYDIFSNTKPNALSV